MSLIERDDAAVLASLADSAERGMPRMSLDEGALLEAGRRRRRRAVATRAAAGGALAAVLAVAAVQVSDPGALSRAASALLGHRDAAPAPGPVADTAPRTRKILPGVLATVSAGERVLADGTRARLLGLEASSLSSTGRDLAVVPNDGANEASVAPAPWLDSTLDLALLDGASLAEREHWDGWAVAAPLTHDELAFWATDGVTSPAVDDPRVTGGRPGRLPAGAGWAMAVELDDGTWLVVGLVPAASDPAALARVTLRAALTSGGASTTTLDLPTFRVGTADGRRMFAATLAAGLGLPRPDVHGSPTTILERVPVPLVPAGASSPTAPAADAADTLGARVAAALPTLDPAVLPAGYAFQDSVDVGGGAVSHVFASPEGPGGPLLVVRTGLAPASTTEREAGVEWAAVPGFSSEVTVRAGQRDWEGRTWAFLDVDAADGSSFQLVGEGVPLDTVIATGRRLVEAFGGDPT